MKPPLRLLSFRPKPSPSRTLVDDITKAVRILATAGDEVALRVVLKVVRHVLDTYHGDVMLEIQETVLHGFENGQQHPERPAS